MRTILAATLLATAATSLIACADQGDASDPDDYEVVPEGKEDSYRSPIAQEFTAKADATVTLAESARTMSDAERLAAAQELVSAKLLQIGWFLNLYVADKEPEDANKTYGGFHAMARNSSVKSLSRDAGRRADLQVQLRGDDRGAEQVPVAAPRHRGLGRQAGRSQAGQAHQRRAARGWLAEPLRRPHLGPEQGRRRHRRDAAGDRRAARALDQRLPRLQPALPGRQARGRRAVRLGLQRGPRGSRQRGAAVRRAGQPAASPRRSARSRTSSSTRRRSPAPARSTASPSRSPSSSSTPAWSRTPRPTPSSCAPRCSTC